MCNAKNKRLSKLKLPISEKKLHNSEENKNSSTERQLVAQDNGEHYKKKKLIKARKTPQKKINEDIDQKGPGKARKKRRTPGKRQTGTLRLKNAVSYKIKTCRQTANLQQEWAMS